MVPFSIKVWEVGDGRILHSQTQKQTKNMLTPIPEQKTYKLRKVCGNAIKT